MKKTFFMGLKAFCVSALAFAAVSCYDDTGILEKLDNLDARLTKVEQDLNTEVDNLEALVAALDAKVAVVAVQTTDGKVVLTLADGTKVELSQPLTNVDNNGLVTIVEEDGVQYWAVVGVEGHTGVPVGHPDYSIDFQINAETKELEYSVNGAAWVSTGVKAEAANAAIMTDFVEGEDYVEIVVNGTKIVLEKYVADNANLGLSRADFFIRYEGSKTLTITAEGLAEVYVMAKPNGWSANIDGENLVVKAPTKAAIQIGAAEDEGLIVLHATDEQGKCKTAKVSVKAGLGLTLTVDINGNLVVKNAYTGEKVSMWGDVSFGFEDFVFGLATPEDFHADPKAYVEFYNTNWSAPNYMDPIFPSMYNVAMGGEYVEGEYEVDVIETTVAEVYAAYYWSEPEPGASFVVWAAPIVPGSEGKADYENLVYADYVNIVWEVEASNVTHSDITISANVAGASQFIIGYAAESDYNSEWNPMTFEDYMNSAMGGPWSGFTKYGATEALGMLLPAEQIPAEFNLSDVIGQKLMAGENYKVWVMPVFDHLAKLDEANSYPEYDYYVYDYSAFKFDEHFLPFVLDVKTNDLVAGGAHAAELKLNMNDFTSIYVDVTPSEGTESVYYYWYSEEDYNYFENDAEIMADLLANCYSPLTEADQVSKTYVDPAQTYILATVSIGTDGKYGEIVAQSFSTRSIPTAADITVEAVETTLSEDGKTYTVKVKVTGGTKVMGYNISDNEYNWTSFPKNVCVNGHKTTYYGYQMADVVDGEATLTFSYSSYKNAYYVAAYTVADDAVNAICAEPARIALF